MRDAAVFGRQEPKLFDFSREGFSFEAFRDHIYAVLDADCGGTLFERACMKQRLYQEIENMKRHCARVLPFTNVILRDATIEFDPMVKSNYPRKDYCIRWYLDDASCLNGMGRKYRWLPGDVTYLGNVTGFDLYVSHYAIEPAKLIFKQGDDFDQHSCWNPYEEPAQDWLASFSKEAYKRARALGFFLDLPEDIFGRPDFQETQPM